MGVCLPKENNQYVISIYDKKSIGKTELSRYTTNFSTLKSLKSIKNLSNSDNRIQNMMMILINIIFYLMKK